MQLSEQEMKLVRRLENQGRAWIWARWVALLVGLMVVASSAFCLQRLGATLVGVETASSAELVFCAFVAPPCWALLCLGAGAVGYSLAFWRGNPTAKLLLRLVNLHEREMG